MCGYGRSSQVELFVRDLNAIGGMPGYGRHGEQRETEWGEGEMEGESRGSSRGSRRGGEG